MRSLGMAWVAALVLLSDTPALASSSLSCHFNDRNLKFGAEATFSHGVGEGFVSLGATLQVLAKTLRKTYSRWTWASNTSHNAGCTAKNSSCASTASANAPLPMAMSNW
jgi:hypothetical protein